MTDQTIPTGLTREEAQAVREWAEFALTALAPDKPVAKAARVVLAALPSPPRPTLADMTDDESAACRWMQADVAGHSTRYVIANPCDDENEAALIDSDGEIDWIFPEYVTPRPDLPRAEWPGDTPTGPDHLAVGTVIESADDPRLDAKQIADALTAPLADTFPGLGRWDEQVIWQLFQILTCPTPCVGHVNAEGWHTNCQRRAADAMTALGFTPPPLDPIPKDDPDDFDF